MKMFVLSVSLLALAACSTFRTENMKQKKPDSSDQGGKASAKTVAPEVGSPEWYKAELEEADNGNRRSQYRIALCYAIGECGLPKDERLALKYYSLAAEQGSADAINKVAIASQFGIDGVSKDLAMAAYWYRRGAEAGDPSAADMVGAFYEKGDGLPQSFGEAVKWYRAAAETGNTGGQQDLGEMYAKGSGVQRDSVQAHMWLSLACANGGDLSKSIDNETAKFLPPSPCLIRARLARLMTADQVVRAQAMALKWRPRKTFTIPGDAQK